MIRPFPKRADPWFRWTSPSEMRVNRLGGVGLAKEHRTCVAISHGHLRFPQPAPREGPAFWALGQAPKIPQGENGQDPASGAPRGGVPE